jgi:hypothetical protein
MSDDSMLAPQHPKYICLEEESSGAICMCLMAHAFVDRFELSLTPIGEQPKR